MSAAPGTNHDGGQGSAFNTDPLPEHPFVVRSYRDADREACSRLYREGLLGGKLAENDTGFDIDDIAQAYMKRPGHHFWVAQTPDGQVVGMIGVQKHDEGDGEIRRLRVSTRHRRRGIGKALVEQAVRFCTENECLKITLDTFVDREPARQLFERFKFQHARTRMVGDKEVQVFYLNLYQGDGQPQNEK